MNRTNRERWFGVAAIRAEQREGNLGGTGVSLREGLVLL